VVVAAPGAAWNGAANRFTWIKYKLLFTPLPPLLLEIWSIITKAGYNVQHEWFCYE